MPPSGGRIPKSTLAITGQPMSRKCHDDYLHDSSRRENVVVLENNDVAARRLQATSAFYRCCESPTRRLRSSAIGPPTKFSLHHRARLSVLRCTMPIDGISSAVWQVVVCSRQRRSRKESEAINSVSSGTCFQPPGQRHNSNSIHSFVQCRNSRPRCSEMCGIQQNGWTLSLECTCAKRILQG